MRTFLCALILLVLCSPVAAQRYSTLPGVVEVPNDLKMHLKYLQEQQLDALQLFTEYLEERVEKKEVPEGLLWNARAVLIEAEMYALKDPQKKKKKMGDLEKIYEKRKQLDADQPDRTWFGVDRVAIGKLMRSEFQRYQSNFDKKRTQDQ